MRHVLLLALLLAAAAFIQPAAFAQPAEVLADGLGLRVDAATGTYTLVVRDRSGSVHHEAPMPGVSVDGVHQAGFTATGPNTFENDALVLTVEVLGPRTLAATWMPKSEGAYDFDLHLKSDDRTRYYGTGERFNALDQRGYILPNRTDDRYGVKGVGTHKPIPFFMSSHGFGVWVDSFAPGLLDLSGTERFETHLRFRDRRLRVVFFGGPSLAGVLDAFTAQTGRPRVPPPWAFGLWKSRDKHHNTDSVYVDIESLRRYDIPASVLVLDSPWEVGYNDFEVNRTQFENADRMFADIERLGFALCLWLTPFVNHTNVKDAPSIVDPTSTYAEAAEAGHLVEDSTGTVASMAWWKGEGGLVDFTDPAAVAWWHDQLAKTLPTGARAFKADDGEGNFVPDAVFHDGSTPAMMKNRYAALYDSVMQAFIDERLDGDGALLVRTAYTGAQQYPFSWAGDNYADFSPNNGLASVLLAGQNAALSGIPLWGHDIAGYAGRPTPELFVRWTQLGAFSPLMQVHMTSNQGPWDFGPEALAIFRKYARLRTTLFPYLYSAAHEAAATGMPIIRPMALAVPDDDEAHKHWDQYFFGPDLLVAPVVREAARSRTVYLPAGTWIDHATGARIEGGRVVEVEAPLALLPLFVRAGALIPALPGDVDTLVEPSDALGEDVVALDEDVVPLDDRRALQVWPGNTGALTVHGGDLAAQLTTVGGRHTLAVTSQMQRPVVVHLMHTQAADVQAEGAAVADTAAYDAEAQRTVIDLGTVSGTRTISWEVLE